MLNIGKKLQTLGLSESGAASVEFVIVFPFFVGIFLSAFEVAMMNTRAVMLERSVDLTVRDIRLSSGATLNYEAVRDRICGRTTMIEDCENVITIELTSVDINTFAGVEDSATCIRRDLPIQPIVKFENGTEDELMLIRVCAVVDPFFPNVGVGRSMPKDPTGGYQITTSSAFLNEPA